MFRQVDIPVVYIGSRVDCNKSNYVVIDDFKAGYMATEYLMKLGHSNIAFIGGHDKSTSHESYKWLQTSIKENRLEADINSIKGYSFKKESGYGTFLKMVKIGKCLRLLLPRMILLLLE